MSNNLTTTRTRTIQTVSVVGAGVMGRGIAAINATHNIPVMLWDNSEEALATGLKEVREQSPLVSGSRSDSELAASDLIVEAVIERLPVKQRILKRLESLAHLDTILASNTSSIPITTIADKLTNPQRFCGLHFCHPVTERRLLEIVRGRQTSDETVNVAISYAKSIGKLPIVVKDSPGFVVNRLLTLYLNEATELLLEGAEAADIEAAAIGFGMPVGPLHALDEIGIDVALRAGAIIHDAFSDRIESSELLIAMMQIGQLGRKSGIGFFAYDGSQVSQSITPTAMLLIQEQSRNRKIFSREEIVWRLFLPMLTEAVHVLDEGLVANPGDIDLAMIHGIGFPESQGGLFGWADATGRNRIMEQLNRLASLGPRYRLDVGLESIHAADRFVRQRNDNQSRTR